VRCETPEPAVAPDCGGITVFHVTCIGISSDGRWLAAGDQGGKVYLWRLTPDKWDQGLQNAELKDEQLAELWKDLTSGDARVAHRAVWTLAAARLVSVKYFDARLEPAEATTDDKVRSLIRDLDKDDYKTRAKATAELKRVAHPAEKQVRATLAECAFCAGAGCSRVRCGRRHIRWLEEAAPAPRAGRAR
jgi:hypothetical protein